MSNERELLKKVLLLRTCEALIPDIERLLAQPKQEPVAHCRVFPLKGNESTPQVGIIWVDTPITGALYTAPPKREPMSDTRCPYPEETSGEYRDGFTDGILYAEKAHGIGGGHDE